VQVCVRLTDASMDKRAKRAGASHLYAFYAHLSMAFVTKGQALLEGNIVGATGNTGNATNTPPHLHFEIRTQPKLPKGSGRKGRLDPGEVLGYEHYTSEP
jgi:murein DD-endopeptidase MepM/ murein hydrolase activator NlpD